MKRRSFLALGLPLQAAARSRRVAMEYTVNVTPDREVDVWENSFGAHDENRVEFSRGRDVRLAPRQQAEPLNFFVDAYGEREGRKWDGVRTTVVYQDLI